MRSLRLIFTSCLVLGSLAAGPADASGLHDIINLGRPVFFSVESEPAVIDVERCCHSYGEASVRVTTSAGSATPGVDYTDTARTIRFTEPIDAGEAEVRMNDDSEQESLETVAVALSDVSGGATIGYPKAADITIIDNDGPARVSLSAPTVSTFENRAYVEVIAIRSGPIGVSGSASYATGDGSALAAEDYDTAAGTISWAAHERVKRFRIDLVDNAAEEGAETFSVSIGSPSGLELAEPSTTTVTIQDDESPSSDAEPPITAFHQPLHGRTYASSNLRDVLVFADDADGSGLKRISIAILKKTKAGRCRWLDKSARRFVRGSCSERHWMSFPGSDLLAYPLPERLEPSKGEGARVRFYKAFSRATDVVGNVEVAFDEGRNVSAFEIR